MDSDSADKSDVEEPEEEEPAPDEPTSGNRTPLIHRLPPKLIPSTRSVQHPSLSSELVMIPMDILPQSVSWPASEEQKAMLGCDSHGRQRGGRSKFDSVPFFLSLRQTEALTRS